MSGEEEQPNSFKARLAMFNQPSSAPQGPPPPKPKPREWKRPSVPSPQNSEGPPQQPASASASASGGGAAGGAKRDFSADDAKQSIGQGGGSLKSRIAMLQGLNAVPGAPASPKSPQPQDVPDESSGGDKAVDQEAASAIEGQDDQAVTDDSRSAAPPPPPAAAAASPSPAASPAAEEEPVEKGILAGAGGPSAPLAAPRRAAGPKRRAPAKSASSSSSVPKVEKEKESDTPPAPQEAAHVAETHEDELQPVPDQRPEEIPDRERDTMTSPAPVGSANEEEVQDDIAKKEMPVSGLQQQDPEPQQEQQEPEQQPTEEEEEAARKERLKKKMASMGGQRLGMFPMPGVAAPAPPPQPARASSTMQPQPDADPVTDDMSAPVSPAVEKPKTPHEQELKDAADQEEQDAEDYAKSQEAPQQQPEEAEEEDDAARRERLKKKMESMGGQRLGMFPVPGVTAAARPGPERTPSTMQPQPDADPITDDMPGTPMAEPQAAKADPIEQAQEQEEEDVAEAVDDSNNSAERPKLDPIRSGPESGRQRPAGVAPPPPARMPSTMQPQPDADPISEDMPGTPITEQAQERADPLEEAQEQEAEDVAEAIQEPRAAGGPPPPPPARPSEQKAASDDENRDELLQNKMAGNDTDNEGQPGMPARTPSTMVPQPDADSATESMPVKGDDTPGTPVGDPQDREIRAAVARAEEDVEAEQEPSEPPSRPPPPPARVDRTEETAATAQGMSPSSESRPAPPPLPPQFRKDAEDSDEEREQDDDEWDEPAPASSTLAPPQPLPRKAAYDSEDAESATDPEQPSRAPPPLPAGRPAMSPPQSKQPSVDEAQSQAASSVSGAPVERRTSQASSKAERPTLGLDTQSSGPSDSVASPNRRSSAGRPKIPPPFSPPPQAAEFDSGESRSLKSPASPRRSMESTRRSAILESPVESPQLSRAPSTSQQSRPASMIAVAEGNRAERVPSVSEAKDETSASPATETQAASEQPEEEPNEEQEEQARRQRIAERMRKLGGQKFGMFPMMGAPKPPSRKTSAAEDEGDSAGKSPTSPASPSKEQRQEPENGSKRRSFGMPRGGVALPGIFTPKSPAPPAEDEAEPPTSPAAGASIKEEQIKEEQETPEGGGPTDDPEAAAAPPPLPPARPPPALDTSAANVSSAEQPVQSPNQNVTSPSLPSRPAGGHSDSPVASPNTEAHSFINFEDERRSLDLADPREQQSASSLPSASVGGAAAAQQPTEVDEAATRPLDQYTESELQAISEQYGSRIFAKARAKAKEGTRFPGENPSWNFVTAVIADVADIDPPEGKNDAFGQLLYRIDSPSGPMPKTDLVRLGDIVVVKQAKLRAKLGSTSIGMGSRPFVGVICDDYDPKKHKIHFFECNKSGKVEQGGFHLDHLKEGAIEIYRAVPKRA